MGAKSVAVCVSSFRSAGWCVCVCVCVCLRERRGMIVHTPTLLCFPPTNTPVEIGHPWPTCSATVTPAHTHILLLTDLTSHISLSHIHAWNIHKQEKKKDGLHSLLTSMLCKLINICLFCDIDTIVFAYSFACLYQITHLESSSRCCLFSQVVFLEFTAAQSFSSSQTGKPFPEWPPCL